MCLIVLAIGQSTEYPLILAGNRDEFHARATQEADWWSDKPDVFGGRDLQAGGTWLALHRNGRFATVTNFRDAQPVSPQFRSRGHLVTEFLESDRPPLQYLEAIEGPAYAGFNLIVGDLHEVAFLSNRDGEPRALPDGLYGLGNEALDGPGDKVRRSKEGLAGLLAQNTVDETTLLRLLDDRSKGPIEEVDSSIPGTDRAHAVTAPFIVMPDYGTRCSTVVLANASGEWRMIERRFNAQGVSTGESGITFATRT
ncbi:MAG: NRDE family protein [Gammaproteobacteria bacterium]|nr:NRDE family protein [Gammaproteobacteria bacterium]MBT8111338.1 NRDE family protein [Gammaproteobacteria bacterium]NND46097.1 NRDE family protein [Woeseiaceae bacterium]NNL46036.1 NRDE family protein [Woeseiaceae bacterium]